MSIVIIGLVTTLLIYFKGDIFSSSESVTAIPIKIGVSKTPLSAPFYVAQARDIFVKNGLDVTVVEYLGGNRALTGLLDGDVSYSTTSDLPIMYNSFTRDDYEVLTTFVTSSNDPKLGYLNSSRILSVQDLVGKRIAVTKGSSGEYFLYTFLLINNIDISTVILVDTPPEQMTDALKTNQVDVVATWEPFAYNLSRDLGAENISYFEGSSEIYTETFNLVSSVSFSNENPEASKRLLISLKEAIDYINQNPEDSKNIVKERLEQSPEFMNWIWDDLAFRLTLDPSLLLTLKNEAKWAINYGLVPYHVVPSYSVFINSSFLNEVSPPSVTLIN